MTLAFGNANCFPADRSKTGPSTRFQTEVNLSTDLNRDLMLRLRLGFKQKYNARYNPKDKATR